MDTHNLVIYNSDCLNLLAVKAYKTLTFIEHFHGYEVESTSQDVIVNIYSLIDPHVLVIHNLTHIHKYIIVLKHHICNTVS